jgi:exportin-2 (importin alpha re-exporter)
MTAMNLNVNIVQFSDNIFGDLQAAAGGAVHPALQVDAIRYLYTFRYQVRLSLRRAWLSVLYLSRQFTKEHLVSVLPLLLNRLGSQEVVVYTRAAVALDCILSMRAGGSTTLTYDYPLLFSPRLTVKFAGSHPRTCSRSCRGLSMSSSPRSAAYNEFLVRWACAFHTLHIGA